VLRSTTKKVVGVFVFVRRWVLSAGNILTPDMLLGMANDPIVLMANPDPKLNIISL
jgi:malic enzyme